MKKKNTKRENVNLFFSAFLMLAYIVCGYFFVEFANSLGSEIAKAAVTAVILVVFGLLVFYATRVGEGKPIMRFSIITLILLDIPALYIIIASIFAPIPLHSQLANAPIVTYMAAVALGYGIPYTFLSGFETAYEEAEEEEAEAQDEEPEVLEGGVEADLEPVEEAAAQEEPEDEVVVEGVSAEDETEEDAPAEDKEESEAETEE